VYVYVLGGHSGTRDLRSKRVSTSRFKVFTCLGGDSAKCGPKENTVFLRNT